MYGDWAVSALSTKVLTLSTVFVPLLKKVFTSTMRIWYSCIVSIAVFELNKVPVKCKSCVVRLFTDSFA